MKESIDEKEMLCYDFIVCFLYDYGMLRKQGGRK